ncbi:unnamed protein product [Toxocara canis]|uniref:Clr5 domain-containing protein n=1 Tax=Toxocara canis TaxID=6265 RepID=A0A183VCJ0_TOXCA|nr:unnamed protein product [Toxocara canis]
MSLNADPAFQQLKAYFNSHGKQLKLMELFHKDPQRFEKFRYGVNWRRKHRRCGAERGDQKSGTYLCQGMEHILQYDHASSSVRADTALSIFVRLRLRYRL